VLPRALSHIGGVALPFGLSTEPAATGSFGDVVTAAVHGCCCGSSGSSFAVCVPCINILPWGFFAPHGLDCVCCTILRSVLLGYYTVLPKAGVITASVCCVQRQRRWFVGLRVTPMRKSEALCAHVVAPIYLLHSAAALQA
jgi:hypothetical protein